MAPAEFFSGVALVVLASSDIFRTVLLPRPTHRALRLAPTLSETLSPAWRKGASRIGGVLARQTFRARLQMRGVLTIQLAATVTRPFTGLAILLALGRYNSHDRLPSLFVDWSRWSANVLYSHRANAILVEFRSADEGGEWLAAATLILAYFESSRSVAEVSAAREFYLTGGHAVVELARLFGFDVAAQDPREHRPERGEEIRRVLTDAGFAVAAGSEPPQRAAAFRSSYFGRLRAQADAFDIRIEQDFLAIPTNEVGPLADEKHFHELPRLNNSACAFAESEISLHACPICAHGAIVGSADKTQE